MLIRGLRQQLQPLRNAAVSWRGKFEQKCVGLDSGPDCAPKSFPIPTPGDFGVISPLKRSKQRTSTSSESAPIHLTRRSLKPLPLVACSADARQFTSPARSDASLSTATSKFFSSVGSNLHVFMHLSTARNILSRGIANGMSCNSISQIEKRNSCVIGVVAMAERVKWPRIS